MKINYCLPIIKKDKRDIFEIIEKNISEYRYFEVWLDYVSDFDETFITNLITLLQERLIVLFRRQNLEPMIMNQQQRLETILLLSNSPAFVDLDISQIEELKYITKNAKHTKLILSYHNYKITPSEQNLQRLLVAMKKYNPQMYKLATFCQSQNDAVRLLQLQQTLKAQNTKHIILGMGKFGTITRVFGTLWGNEMIFSPKTLDEKSADGQLTKLELEKIFEILITKH